VSLEPWAVHEVVGRWWCSYDEGEFDAFPDLLTSDVHFTCRTDTGATEYEEFVRADVWGRDDVVAWQIDHRRNSPYPLRHNATNLHVVARRDEEADFGSYLFVTHVVDGITPLSTAIVTGTVRRERGAARLAGLHVVLDTMRSVVFDERPRT
jgi:hypothetical protein